VAAFLGAVVLVKSLTIYIPMGSVGVRTQEYSILGSQGVVQDDFGPGWHRDLGPIDSWTLFDATVQTLEMAREADEEGDEGSDDIKIQSADGYTVSVDVTVKYRIMANKAHRLFQDTGSREKYKVIVKTGAQDACTKLFGQMKTEEFYMPSARRQRQDEARAMLVERLDNNYVEVIDVLMRDVMFDPEYENKIRRKTLADQEVELNKATARANEMHGKTQVIEAETQKMLTVITQEKDSAIVMMGAETDREIAKIDADAQKYSTKKRADADLVKAENGAKGQLLVKRAEAEGEKLRNRSMMGSGGSMIVALEAARNLRLSDIAISTVDTDLLDVNKMATKLGAP
jgi:regulator of protease activity HflC (stomatin/prohibitin superfamily)